MRLAGLQEDPALPPIGNRLVESHPAPKAVIYIIAHIIALGARLSRRRRRQPCASAGCELPLGPNRVTWAHGLSTRWEVP